MRRIIFLTLFTVATFNLCAQEETATTNAFEDLQRKGVMAEEESIMRIYATDNQLHQLKTLAPDKGYYCFTESRERALKSINKLPKVWAERDLSEISIFKGNARPDEFFTYQVGIYAANKEVNNVDVKFKSLKNRYGDAIPASAMRCFNLGGTNLNGDTFSKDIDVSIGEVYPLWIGVEVPADASGEYVGTLEVRGDGVKSTTITVVLNVRGEPIENHGYNEGANLSRLAWLDSKVGASSEPTKPYTPIEVSNNKISYLGGEVTIGKNGLPSSIETKYTDMNQLSNNVRNDVISSPIEFSIINKNGASESLNTKKNSVTKRNNATASWSTTLTNGNFNIEVLGVLNFDGAGECSIKVTALKDIEVEDFSLNIPFTEKSSKYSVGLNQKGGELKNESYNWSWDTTKHQDIIWIGGVNAGLNLKLKDENYLRPLVNIYYALGPINLPKSWGSGGVKYLRNQNRDLDLTAYSGARKLKKGEVLNFNFEMLITPVKPLDFKRQITERFYHSNSDESTNYIKDAKEAGATRINIHHKKDIYPYINYPYYDDNKEDLQNFVVEAKKEGLDVGVYYTTRELTVKTPEIWALRSLGSEVLHDGPGPDTKTLIHPNGPNEWLNNNFESNFIPAWYNAFNSGRYKGELDISVITTPDSRWNNYYLAGLEWMTENLGINGVYIDDSALDRLTLQRARRILDSNKENGFIDIHSWNHFNQWAGYANSLHMYLDLLPYVDRTWIGEGFPEGNSLDFWMVEMAGIPYGQFSETLDARNIFKGLIYAMTPRYVWSGDPRSIWKMYDNFGMKDAEMYGYWSEGNPASTSNENLPTTTYINKGDKKAIIVVAQWGEQSETGKIAIDESKLGFKPSKASLVDLGIYQKSGNFNLTEEFTIEKGSGLVILIE